MKTVSLNSEDLLPLIEETLKLNSSFNLKVKGNSMRPFLRNDLSKVLLIKPEDLRKNDICLFKYQDKVVLHRLRKIDEDKFYFVGDAQKHYEIVSKENIIAKVEVINNKNKEVLTKNKCYLFKVKLWYFLKPFRRILLKVLPR